MRWEVRFCIFFYRASLTPSLYLSELSLQHSLVLCKLVHLSSEMQRLQTSARSCKGFFFFLNRWIGPQASRLTGSIWAAACSDCSRLCHPSIVITLRKCTESFHQDHQKCSACIKLPLLLSWWQFLLYGRSCCKGSGQVQATCCFCQVLFYLFIFPS